MDDTARDCAHGPSFMLSSALEHSDARMELIHLCECATWWWYFLHLKPSPQLHKVFLLKVPKELRPADARTTSNSPPLATPAQQTKAVSRCPQPVFPFNDLPDPLIEF
ncbi:uncharacterized protein AAES06_011663 isoform 1-T1 [Glossophaga mutica]